MSAKNRGGRSYEGAEIPKLLAKQRELMKHQALLNECLAIVREERNKLQIEHLQLESMIGQVKNENCEERLSQPPPIPCFKPLDLETASKINNQTLDLSMANSLTSMLEGKFYAEEAYDYEEYEEEDEDDEDVDVLTINECLTLD
ncbi:snRNA-activating protein complex subunit 5 [Anabrus simplex]|uniref:snRNA-activating protein complex subunit 5 n=1 Tax=Anabrus simplex TaxID=316456 RepID=UPI0034DD4F81